MNTRLRQTVIDAAARVLKISGDELEQCAAWGKPWDSLAQLNIILAVEEACNLRFSPERIPDLNSMEAILDEVRALMCGSPGENRFRTVSRSRA